MTICREWSLVKSEPEIRRLRPLFCRSWTCDVCAPRRRLQLMAAAASGQPNRFITLTISPDVGVSPAERLLLLSRAWRVTVQRLRRLHPTKTIDYLAIVEGTKNGEPHLHILFRGPWVSQSYLSDCMREIISSPIVDIRAIKSQRHVINYVAKYITKAPAQFGTAKRYWQSRTYEIAKEPRPEASEPPAYRWTIDRRPLHEILHDWMREGYISRRDRGDSIVGFLSPPGESDARFGLWLRESE